MIKKFLYLIVGHRVFKERCKFFFTRSATRCKFGDTFLGKSAFHKVTNIWDEKPNADKPLGTLRSSRKRVKRSDKT